MFERFTDKAIKVIMLAQEESRRLGHNFVSAEQILLGLLAEGTGIACRILRSKGCNLRDARVEVEKIIGRGSGFVAVEIPFTPRAKLVLGNAWDESHKRGDKHVSTEHLLLGMISIDCVAVTVLKNMGLDVVYISNLVQQEMGASASHPDTVDTNDSEPQQQAKLAPLSTTQVCPNCAETIKAIAHVCYFCSYGISDELFTDCKFCKERIRRDATKCKHCFSEFSSSKNPATLPEPPT